MRTRQEENYRRDPLKEGEHDFRRLYPNGDTYIYPGCPASEIQALVGYNMAARPGNSLWLDGKWIRRGIGVTAELEAETAERWSLLNVRV